MDDSPRWFLLKQADETVFGPMPFSQLRQFAEDACISPLDKVSCDEITWTKAPMIPELHMDFLLELEPGNCYGPTTVGAIREFFASSEITMETLITDCLSGTQLPLREFPHVIQNQEQRPLIRVSARENLQGRIRQLEEALVQERHLRRVAEEARAKAEQHSAELENLLGIGTDI